MTDPLLTIFTAPKPFTNPHISIIQHNALTSWVNLGSRVEVLLIGEEKGIGEVSETYGIRQIPDVRRNECGTPFISSMFALARRESSSPFLAIINADILLFPEMILALETVAHKFPEFLIVGQRWDLEIQERLSFSKNFYASLQQNVKKMGRLHSPTGSDYFIFPRACFLDIPDFAIGRAGWDNWMFFKSRWEGWPLIDASQDVMVIHQKHDYSHLANGQPHYHLPETAENVRLAGGEITIFTLLDANYTLKSNQIIRPNLSWRKFWREVEIFPLSSIHSRFLGWIFYFMFHPIKSYQRFRIWLRR